MDKPPRNIRDGPFCWQSKPALRLIRDGFDGTNDVASAIAVYTALTEIASDEEGETFTRRKAEIAHRCGLSYRTTANVIKRLGELNLLRIEGNKLPGTKCQAPSTYTLLSFGTECPTSGNGYRRLGNGAKRASLPRGIEESENNTRTTNEERGVNDSWN